MSDSIVCNKCGQLNPEGTTFCIHCGMPMFDLEDLNEEGLEKLLQDDHEVPHDDEHEVIAEEDFISGVCKNCGAVLDIAKDVEQVTCPLCGTAHEVVYQYGEAMLLPLKRTAEDEEPAPAKPAKPETLYELEPEPEPELEPFQPVRYQPETSPDILQIKLDEYQDINIIDHLRAEQSSLEVKQQIFDLEHKVRENKALIRQQGTTEGDIRNGVVGLLVCVLLGVLAESMLQQRLGYAYEHGLIAMLTSMLGVVWMVWCWFTSRFPTAQEGSRVVKENQRLEAQIRSFRDSIDFGPPQEIHPFREMLQSIQLPRGKTKKQPPWICTNCGSKNEGIKRTCTKCGAVHKQRKSIKAIILIGYFGLMGLCLLMLTFTWLFTSLFDFLPIQPAAQANPAQSEVAAPVSEGSLSVSNDDTTILTENKIETDCLLWSDVTLADVGKTMCVYGIVFDRYQGDGNHYNIRFSDDYVSFRMVIKVAPDALIPAFDQGECIYQTGVIHSYGDLTYMDVTAPVARCTLK